jgi:hypothetical protein
VGGDERDRPGEVAVVHAGAWPTLICRNAVDPDMTAAPVFAGPRLFLRKGAQQLVCIAATTPEGRQYQEQRVAAILREEFAQSGLPIHTQPATQYDSGRGTITIGILKDNGKPLAQMDVTP